MADFFHFRYFTVRQRDAAMKIGTDSMLLGAFVNANDKKHVLDVGTGTGVLSLMLAQRNPELTVDAVELDEATAHEAVFNFSNAQFYNTFKVIHQDFLTFSPGKKYDLIVSNPPFFEKSLKPEHQSRSNARHDENLPLGDLFRKVSGLLSEEGDFWVILPVETFDYYFQDQENQPFFLHQQITLFGKPGKPIRKIGRLKLVKAIDVLDETFLIRNANGNYTEDYIGLTKDFHATDLSKKA